MKERLIPGSDAWVRANWAGDPKGVSQQHRGVIALPGHSLEYVEQGPNHEVLRYPVRPPHWMTPEED